MLNNTNRGRERESKETIHFGPARMGEGVKDDLLFCSERSLVKFKMFISGCACVTRPNKERSFLCVYTNGNVTITLEATFATFDRTKWTTRRDTHLTDTMNSWDREREREREREHLSAISF